MFIQLNNFLGGFQQEDNKIQYSLQTNKKARAAMLREHLEYFELILKLPTYDERKMIFWCNDETLKDLTPISV